MGAVVDAGGRSGLAERLPSLLREAGVGGVELVHLHRGPSFRGGRVSSEAKAITGEARSHHRNFGFGFWEFALASSVEVGGDTREALIDGALRHGDDGVFQNEISRDAFEIGLETREYEGLPPRHLISLSSKVRLVGAAHHLHLPMLDFGVKAGPAGEAAVLSAVKALGQDGLLFESGSSYHFYGAKPVPWGDLVKILGRALLLSPLVDARWVSHQLIDGRCSLRISTDQERSPVPPSFVGNIGR